MESCDVLIVGGGPGGSSCARALVRAGLDVVVLDRKTFPRDKTCAGWVTPQVLDTLALDREGYAKERVLQPITGFEVRRMGNRPARVRYDVPVSYGILRREFDHYLLERSGARLRLGEPLKRLVRECGRWIANDALAAPVVIGAGGHFCPVARQLARGAEPEPIVAAQEVEFRLDPDAEADCPVQPEVPELFFTRDLVGYGWVFRKGAHLNVGLGRQDRHRLSDHLRAFVSFLRAEGRLPGPMSDSFQGHAYLLHGQAPRPLLDEGVLLIGDAAGLAYAKSGEGIRPAIESGLLAARTLLAARGRYDRAALSPYEGEIERRFGPRAPGRTRSLTDFLPRAVTRRLAGTLLGSEAFVRNVVVERWFLHTHQPPLPTL